jgi:hypothetical protein
VHGHELLRVVAVSEELLDDAVELPRSGRAAGIVVVPRHVDLEAHFGVLGHKLVILGQVHQLTEVINDGFGLCLENRHY